MKNLIYIIFLTAFPYFIFAQSLQVKSIVKFDNLQNVDGYSFKFDERSGTYLYSDYDSTELHQNKIFSNKGNSGNYDYIDYFDAIIDADGNYYAAASLYINDSTSIYYLLKNGREITSFSFINAYWIEKEGKIYFMCTEKEKSFICTFDMSSGDISKGKAYDDIILCSYPKIQYEGEPQGQIGFTSDNRPYYIAKSNNESFVVVGTEEQKHYSDIDSYNFTQDKKGNFVYVAKKKGTFDYAGNAFVVQGDKEYKMFDYIYNIIYDANGTAVYTGADSAGDYTPERVMIGDKVASKTYSGGLYNLGFKNNGKLYFVASEKNKGTDDYSSFVVLDGKEGKRYNSINNLKALNGNSLFYTAQKSNNKSVIVNEEISDNIFDEIEINYPVVLDATVFSDGSLAYVGAIYGNYEKNIKDKMYVHIGNENFGPYEGVLMTDYLNSEYIKFDNKRNYIYIVNNTNSLDEYLVTLYSNKGKSRDFNDIQNVVLYKGSPLFTASYLTDKVNYIYKYRIYYSNNSITPEYDAINDYKFDEKSGTVTFTFLAGKEFFTAEIKF